MKLTLNTPDSLGAAASTLCVIHCAATPFLFIVQSCSTTCCESTPTWWRFIDYLFLVISFFAVYKTTQQSTKSVVKTGLWISWIALFLIIINESMHYIALPHYSIYIPAITLIVLHMYNLKYCQCKTATCCSAFR